MQHPFAGIVNGEPKDHKPPGIPTRDEGQSSRRGFLAMMGIGAAAFLQMLRPGGFAAAQGSSSLQQEQPDSGRSRRRSGDRNRSRQDGQYTTQALGEEAGRNRDERDRYTTYALGEEGGRGDERDERDDSRDERRYTTQALGEEGGRRDDRYTTYALGEEGARNDRGEDRYTTYALGEEGAWGDDRRYRDDRGRYTTYALGEEGGRNWWSPPAWQGWWPPYGPPQGRRRYTTQALGEEGGWR